MTSAQIIAFRPTLQAIAFNMIGSIADAEDIVQDTLLKWFTIDTSKVNNAKAFLQKSVVNNCLNFLSRSKKLEHAEDLDHLEGVNPSVDFHTEGESQLQEAWKILQVKLQPIEQKIYLLREVFNVDYEVLQEVCQRNASHCRQVVCRAKAKLQAELPKISMPAVKIPANFIKACDFGHLSDMIDELKEEILTKAKKSF